MKIKNYFSWELVFTLIAIFLIVILTRLNPTNSETQAKEYLPPIVVDPDTLLHDRKVQERTRKISEKRLKRGFGLGFQLRSNFWLENEEIDLVKLTSNIADTYVTFYGEDKPDAKTQVVKIKSWGATPFVTLTETKNIDVLYYAKQTSEFLITYPEISDPKDIESYCRFYEEKLKNVSIQIKFVPVLSYEYFSGRMDGEVKWEKVKESCITTIGLTTYPTKVYKTMRELPKDYYQDIINTFPKSEILFLDTGWSTKNSSLEDQAQFLDFIHSFAKKNSGVKSLIYGHLFDPFGNEPYYYQETGLVTRDEIKKPAFHVWQRIFNEGVNNEI